MSKFNGVYRDFSQLQVYYFIRVHENLVQHPSIIISILLVNGSKRWFNEFYKQIITYYCFYKYLAVAPLTSMGSVLKGIGKGRNDLKQSKFKKE